MALSRSLSVLVHADSKVGKSTLADTAPAPRLLIDSEMGARFLQSRKVTWNPMTEAPPIWDDSWDTCVVVCRDYTTFLKCYEWLNSGMHPFRSVIIDSVTELQVRVKDNIAPSGRLERDTWGDLLTHMERVIRQFRDLTEHPVRPIEALVLTAMTSLRDGKWRPYVQGALATKMPYFLDVIGYLYVDHIPSEDPTQPPSKIRRLLTSNSDMFEAGERVQGIIDQPNISTMLDYIYGPVSV
jgi:hypothetical protein